MPKVLNFIHDPTDTADRLRELKVQVMDDGRLYRSTFDYLNDGAVQQQMQSLADLGLGKRLK